MPVINRPPRTICILRLSALGDVTHVLPAIRELQKKWPDADITWVCGKFEYKILCEIKGVRFITFDKKAGLKAYFQVWRELQGEKFDLMLHMHATARANLLSLVIRAKVKLGWDKANARDCHHWFVDETIEAVNGRHQVQGYLDFIRAIGGDVGNPVWDFPMTDEANAFVTKHINTDKPVLVISPCSSHDLRNWSVERYAAVADYAIETLNMTVVLSGGPSNKEITMGVAIESHMNLPVTNLIGKDTIQQLLALLKRADVLLGPDSGPAHIANAVGTKVVGLYACTNPKRSGPYNSLDYCVDKYSDAALQFLNKESSQLAWNKKIELDGVMNLIEVDDVIDKLQLALKA